MKPVSTGKRLVTAVVMCGLLVGVSGCESHSVLSGKSVGKSSTSASASAGRDPDRIYANHDKGADPNIKISILCRNTGITMLLLKSGG